MEKANQRMVEDLQSEGKKILVDFWGTWCGPCKLLGPILEKIETDYPNIKFLKVDVSENKDYAMELGITSIPTIMIYDGKELIKRTNGLNKEEYYRNLLDSL